jgi:chromosome segregation ATPase
MLMAKPVWAVVQEAMDRLAAEVNETSLKLMAMTKERDELKARLAAAEEPHPLTNLVNNHRLKLQDLEAVAMDHARRFNDFETWRFKLGESWEGRDARIETLETRATDAGKSHDVLMAAHNNVVARVDGLYMSIDSLVTEWPKINARIHALESADRPDPAMADLLKAIQARVNRVESRCLPLRSDELIGPGTGPNGSRGL